MQVAVVGRAMRSLPTMQCGGDSRLRVVAWAFLIIIFVIVGVLAPVLVFGVWPEAAIPLIYATPAALVALLVLAILLARAGSDRANRLALVAGIAFCAGGAVFDMIATVLHSPDLAREENPFARWLLDTGHQLATVYVFGIVCQLLLIGIVALLWVAMLKSHALVVAQAAGARGFWSFFKAATGGARLSYRQWLLPLRIADAPDPFCVLSCFAALLVAAFAMRWQLGLEWFGLAFASRATVGWSSLLAGLIGYLLWIWLRARGARST